MAKAPRFPVGLIASGRISSTWLLRWRSLRRLLGPVLSFAPRVSARATTILRAGYPVENFSELKGIRVLLISVPDERLAEMVRRLAVEPLPWRTMEIVLCDSAADLDILRPLAAQGAKLAALTPLDRDLPGRLLAEGDEEVIAGLRKMIDDPQLELMDAPPGARRYHTAAESLLEFYAPVLVASLELLRRAGVPVTQYSAVVERRALRVARTYARTGKRIPPPRVEPRAMQALCEADPRAARYFAETAARAARLLTPAEPKARAAAAS